MIEDSQTLRRGFRANQNLIVLHWSFPFVWICCPNRLLQLGGGLHVPTMSRNPAPPCSPRERVFKPLCCFPATIALSGYKGCTERIFTLYLLNSKYALKSMLQAKKYGQKIYPVIRRPRCRSSPPPSRRTLETCHPLSSVRRQGAALLRPGARNS